MLYIIVALGGVVALSWELLWQIHVTLAVGVSAKSTARALHVAPAHAATTHPTAFDNKAPPAALCASSLIDCAMVNTESS